jgi:hypothetical protein
MKNISIQYQDLREGKMNRHQFLRNARMMFPNHVTQFNSFEDSVKILKSKGLLNEGDAVQGTPDKAPTYKYPNEATKYKKVEQSPEVDEQDGIYPATTLTDIPKEKMDKKVKDTSDGLEPIKDKDTKNEMKKVKVVKENVNEEYDGGLLEGTLKEAVKNMVRKALAEYEIGDEEDRAPNDAMAVSRIVDAFIDHANQIDIRKDLSTKADVERAFTKFENEVGKRYSDDVFDNVMDALKNKGYKIK